MTTRAFEIILINSAGRTVRKIIAHSSAQATLIGIRMMTEQDGLRSIICKPVINQERIAQC